MNHRALQRTLFRMQADLGFARALLAGEEEAVRSSGLGEEELALLADVDERALRADPGGKRRTQILGNASSEYRMSLAAAARSEATTDLLSAFATSPELHEALSTDGRLPLAFGAYTLRRSEAEQERVLEAIARLELAMAELRRVAVALVREGDVDRPGADTIVLSPFARIVALPRGTMDVAAELSQELAQGSAPAVACLAPGTERVLLRAELPASVHALADVAVELLQPPVDELLARAAEPLDPAARASFARSKGATPEALESFLAGYVAEGVLLRG